MAACIFLCIYIHKQTHMHRRFFVFKSSYLGFAEKKNIKNKLINKLKSWTIHSVGFRVDQTVSWWEEPDGSAVDQTGSWAPFTTTKAPQLSQSIRPPHPSLCISPHSLETMCVCAYSTSVGAAKVRLSTGCPLHLTPFAEALTWREIVEKSRNQRGTSSLNFKRGSRKRWADMETFTLYEERDRDTEKLGLASNGNSTAN